MAKRKKEKLYHLGSPKFAFEGGYHKDNCEYFLGFTVENEMWLNKLKGDVKEGDFLYLGISESDIEPIIDCLIHSVSDRLKQKLEMYNEYKKTYWLKEFEGKEDEWESSNLNSFQNPHS